MAVYTRISESELKAFLSAYDIGVLTAYGGIEQGVSNSNYHVFTDQGRFILTLFEPHRVDEKDIPFFMEYTICLERAGVVVPVTIKDKTGQTLNRLCDRPAALYSFLSGEGGSVSMLTPFLCERAGETLAKMHVAADSFSLQSANHFGPARWKEWIETIGSRIDAIKSGLFAAVESEFNTLKTQWPSNMSTGAIHADYFPDNVFFKDGAVTGVIDFHFVCTDFYAYDLAIALNAWSFTVGNDFDAARMAAMMRGYQSVRPLSEAELNALPVLLRGAALRFLLSRLEEKLAWTPDNFMVPHDPLVFEKRLKHFQTYSLSESHEQAKQG